MKTANLLHLFYFLSSPRQACTMFSINVLHEKYSLPWTEKPVTNVVVFILIFYFLSFFCHCIVAMECISNGNSSNLKYQVFPIVLSYIVYSHLHVKKRFSVAATEYNFLHVEHFSLICNEKEKKQSLSD